MDSGGMLGVLFVRAVGGGTERRRVVQMADEQTLQQVELALANAKRVQRECKVVVVTLARLRDQLSQSKEDIENDNGTD